MNAHWKTLRFASVGWSADHLRDFAEALPLFTNLKELDLENNKFGDEGARVLAGALKAPLILCQRPNTSVSVSMDS